MDGLIQKRHELFEIHIAPGHGDKAEWKGADREVAARLLGYPWGINL